MDYSDQEEQGQINIESLIEQYEEALANDRQLLVDQEEVEQIADYYENSGHYDKALQMINSALEQHPYSGLILLKKAQLLFDLKILEEAMECLEQVELFEPAELGIYLLKSEIFTFQSLHSEALLVLDHAMRIADGEEQTEVWLHRADVYEDWEKYDEVFRCLGECLVVEPQNEEALSRINYCMEITEAYEEAIAIHLKIIDSYPYCYWAWYNLSFAYASLDLFEKAIDALEYVVAIDEDISYAYKDLAQYYHEIGEYNRALEALADYSGRTRPEAEVHLLEGKCRFELDQVRAARQAFRKAIRTNPSSHEAFYNLGVTYIRDEKWNQAVQHLRKAVELNPDSLEYLERLADVGLQAGDYIEVQHCCARAIRLNSANVQVYITMALSHLFSDEPAEALQVLDKGIEQCDDVVGLCYVRAGMLLLTNQRKAALLVLEDLLETCYDEHEILFTYFPFLAEDAHLTEWIGRYGA